MISVREPPSSGRPNLDATTTSSRLADLASAAPRNSSLLPPPYISAVSKNVIPASSAASTTACVSSGPIRIPKLLQPRPSTDTARPDRPTLRASMETSALSLSVHEPYASVVFAISEPAGDIDAGLLADMHQLRLAWHGRSHDRQSEKTPRDPARCLPGVEGSANLPRRLRHFDVRFPEPRGALEP